MGEVINLRNYRKLKKREEREQEASENRVRSGRKRGQRLRDEQEAEATVSFLDERRIDKDDAGDDAQGGDEEEAS